LRLYQTTMAKSEKTSMKPRLLCHSLNFTQ
jgi:hypothetical protein